MDKKQLDNFLFDCQSLRIHTPAAWQYYKNCPLNKETIERMSIEAHHLHEFLVGDL